MIHTDGKLFCCEGCQQVYLLLNEHNLCSYYDLESNPGIKAAGNFTSGRFAYLEDESIIKKLVQFSSVNQTNITFSLPQVHCSSCVYLLENLHRINQGIIGSRINFPKKEIFISFNPAIISLRKVVELLAFIGYEPSLSLHELNSSTAPSNKNSPSAVFAKQQIYRIGIAGFCFANIMMLSFPEYLSSGHLDNDLKQTFSWLNLLLSIPVLIFSASGIFQSAWMGLRQRFVNIDTPIALAIIVTFARSYYEIISGKGAGYLDSGSGIVFFMLIGRWFQNKTYESLSFDRDYRSYFPLGVTLITEAVKNGYSVREEKNIPVTKLKSGNRIIIRNEEMIPADALLLNGNANVDFSFVNGENLPVKKYPGEMIYAGGKQKGGAIELEVVNEVSQGYLTDLWNNEIFKGAKKTPESYIHPWSRYFTLALFSIALAAVIGWGFLEPANILPVLTAVLIVACPCSLLLSHTFTHGNMLRIFGKNKLYLKNSAIIEALASIDTVVFDKTGTITLPNRSAISYHGQPLSESEKNIVHQLTNQSSHPFSKLIASQWQVSHENDTDIREFKEFSGMGVEAVVNDVRFRMGSSPFIDCLKIPEKNLKKGSEVNLQIGEEYKGYFSISNHYRPGIRKGITALKDSGYELHILSGDNDSEKESLEYIFGKEAKFRFRQLPMDKLEYIKVLQANNKKVLMVGDGLNDAGALMQADVGIAVNDNHAQFTPACDAILEGSRITQLEHFLRYAKTGKKVVTASFILSILYNIIGLSFAVSGALSPIVAALLMPASSISIVLFVTVAGNIMAKKQEL